MMATRAWHKLIKWEMSMSKPDLCYIYHDDGENWIGQWEYGIGAFDVKFPKETTRDLTQEEFDRYDKSYESMGGRTWKLIIEGYHGVYEGAKE